MAALGAYLCPMTAVTMLHPGTRSRSTTELCWTSQALFLSLSSPNYESRCYHTLRITGRYKDTRCAETGARSGRGLDPGPCNDGQPDGLRGAATPHHRSALLRS